MKKILSIFFIFLVIYTDSVFTIVVRETIVKNELTDVSKTLVDIIDNCYADNYKLIILYGNIDNTIINSIYHSKSKWNFIIGDNNLVKTKIKQLHTYQPLVILVTNSFAHLDSNIASLKSFDLWNIQQPFFILHQPTKNDDMQQCNNAYNFLHLTWIYNLLNVFFLCVEDSHVVIWTFNPFINKFSANWKQKQLINSSWTLYNHQYQAPHASFCQSLRWDKTKELNGFKVNALGAHVDSFLSIDLKKSQMKNWKGLDGRNMQTCFKYLNVSPMLTYYPGGETGAVKNNGESTGLFKQLATGQQDIMINSALQRDVKNATMTFRQYYTNIKFIVQKTKNMSTIEKIIRYLGYKLILATIIVSLVTFIALRCYMNKMTGAVCLEMARLITNVSLLKSLNTIPIRTFFGPVLFFFLQFQAIFQGNLASLLTNPVPENNLNTVGDLKSHLEYKLYIAEIQSIVLEDELKSRSVKLPHIACEKYVLNNSKAVCIGTEDYLKKIAAVNNLHLSSGILSTSVVTSFTRKDWPIQRKFGKFLRVTEESGLLNYWKQKEMNYSKKNKKKLGKINDKKKAVVISLNDIIFAFHGLLYFLSFATLAFTIEVKGVAMKNIVNLFKK